MGKAYGINFPNDAANRYFITMSEVFPKEKALEEYKKWCAKLSLEHGVTEIVTKKSEGEYLDGAASGEQIELETIFIDEVK